MIHIIGKGLEGAYKSQLKLIFGHAGIDDHEIRFIDLDHDDLEIEKMNFILCTGDTTRTVVRAKVAIGPYGPTKLIGQDVKDDDLKFALSVLGMRVRDIMLSEENKMAAWLKILPLAEFYRKYNEKKLDPFEDEIPDLSIVTPPESDSIETVQPALDVKTDLETKGGTESNIVEENVTVHSNTDHSERGIALNEVDVNVNELIESLFSTISLSDQTLGKSLSSYSKFTLKTSNANLVIYPTNRVNKEEEGIKMSFKDLICLIKTSTTLGAGIISFEEQSNVNVSG